MILARHLHRLHRRCARARMDRRSCRRLRRVHRDARVALARAGEGRGAGPRCRCVVRVDRRPSWPAVDAVVSAHRSVDAGSPAAPVGDRAAPRGARTRGGARAGGDPARHDALHEGSRDPVRAAVPPRHARAADAALPPTRARDRRRPRPPRARHALPEGFARASDGTLAPVAAAGDAATPTVAPLPEALPRRARGGARSNPLWAWFTGGNALTRIGVVALFFGVAFLLRVPGRDHHGPDRAEARRRRARRRRARRARRAARARAAGLRPVARRRGRRHPVPDDLRRVPPVRRAAGGPGVRRCSWRSPC